MSRTCQWLWSLLVIISLTFSSLGGAAKLYKCRDADGHIVYQDELCTDQAETLREQQYDSPRDSVTTSRSRSRRGPALAVSDGPFLGEESKQWNPFVLAAKLSQVLSSLQGIKTQVHQYWMINGEWPQQLEQIGLDFQEMSSTEINSVQLGLDGAIIASLSETFGDAKMVALSPQIVMGGTSMEWRCATTFTEKVVKGMQFPCRSADIH